MVQLSQTGKEIGNPQEDAKAAPEPFRLGIIPTSSKLKRTLSSLLKEINAANLKRTTVGRSIGSGTFGMFYLG